MSVESISVESVDARYSGGEELANSLTHALGILLSLAGLAAVVAAAAMRGGFVAVVSCAIYGSTLVVLYTTSTLYHSIPSPESKRVLRVLDHLAIFLLIAGTYTPFVLIALRGAWGWALFTIIWTLAIIGIAIELSHLRRFRRAMVVLYIAMGWVGLIAIEPLVAALPAAGLWLLFGGGVCYTLGVPVYLSRRMPFNHALWHVFVLAGSILQFFAVLLYVLPGPRA